MIRYAIAGFLVVAMASAASADHKPNHNPGGGVGEPQPQILVYRDGNGVFMGEAYQLGGFVYRGDPASASFFEDHPLVRVLLWSGSNFQDQNLGVNSLSSGNDSYPGYGVYFLSTDCSGIPYLSYDANFNARSNSPIVPVEELGGEVQLMYVPDSPNAAPQPLEPHSKLRRNAECDENLTGLSFDLVLAATITLNFKMPYTLGY